MITMQEVAEEVGLSRTTVSCVLNNRYKERKISEKTCEKIRETAKRMGYQPNELAISMVKGKTKVIGFIAGNPTVEYGAKIMSGIMTSASDEDFYVKSLHCGHDHDISQIAEICLKQRLAGVICHSLSDQRLRYLHENYTKNKIPIAITDSSKKYDWGIQVHCDDMKGASFAVNHLIDLGHRRIAILNADSKRVFAQIRKQGFLNSIEENNIEFSDDYLIESDLFEEIPERIESLLMKGKSTRPTAFFCGSSYLAMLLLQVAYRLRLRVPDDFSMVGYGNHSMLSYSSPPVTSVEQSHMTMGMTAASLLIKEIKKKSLATLKKSHIEIIEPELVIRQSTASPN